VTERHLVSVWDPSRGPDAMNAHVQVLLDAQRRQRIGDADDEDVYVWWGKIKSPNRQQPLAHLPEILKLDEALRGEEGPDAEVHLYLTDYRSLYVGHVAEVTADDVREDDGDYVPSLYDDVACDCWFRLMDVRRVVLDDTLGVIAELRKLQNTHYHGKPVSIYGGMVNLPLVVTRSDGSHWFEPRFRDPLTEGKLWVEFDAERTGLGTIERDLRENMFGDEAWQGLDPAARTFIATAEKVFRDHRADPAVDFAPVLVDFAKAFEVQVNGVLRSALRSAPAPSRQANVDGKTKDVVRDGPFSLGQLARIVGEERHINEALRQQLRNGAWFAASLPPILRELADQRNPAAHTSRLGRDEALRLRDRLVGVGCVGTLVELGLVKMSRVRASPKRNSKQSRNLAGGT